MKGPGKSWHIPLHEYEALNELRNLRKSYDRLNHMTQQLLSQLVETKLDYRHVSAEEALRAVEFYYLLIKTHYPDNNDQVT